LGSSSLTPNHLLNALKGIEQRLGRTPSERWAPRVIDCDILLYDQLTVNTNCLIIPHPELPNRPFLHHLLGSLGMMPWAAHVTYSSFQKSFVTFPKIMGIVNVTHDSFSGDGQLQPEHVTQHALTLAKEGVSIIDIGAQSTKPHAVMQSPMTEYARLQPVLEQLTLQDNVHISIDTFHAAVVHKILEHYSVQ
jgi:2-amino-4-hydroxy-6-hydroxymethyldihydropteridine diphosphokinase / dihydropteroate synthase